MGKAKTKTKSKTGKVGRIIGNILLYLFLALCIFSVFLTVFSKKAVDGAAEIFGYQMRVVTSASMEKCDKTDVSAYEIEDIPVRSMIFVKVMPSDPAEADEWYRSLNVGDVLTFRYVYTTQVTITHRITSITEKESGGFIIQLAGDNVNDNSQPLYQTIDTSIPNNTNYVIGKVTGQAYLLGVLMSFIMAPAGMILAVILPCAIIMLMEISKIVRSIRGDKAKQAREESERKDRELEELRRRLAELEKGTETADESAGDGAAVDGTATDGTAAEGIEPVEAASAEAEQNQEQ